MNVSNGIAAFVSVLLVSFLVGCTAGNQGKILRQEQARLALTSPSILVNPGTAGEATAYYKRIQARLNLPLLDGADAPRANLTELLEYFGYTGLKAGDLEILESTALMPASQADFDALAKRALDPIGFASGLTLAKLQSDNLLVSRFFAPKIVDYSKAPPYVPGWRKLAKLQAQPGSSAGAAGMAAIYILFNYVNADVKTNPFENNVSKNNQVIIVPKSFDSKNEDSAYFMVFKQAPAYVLGLALDNVAFDLPTVPGTGTYFVPGSCAQCHGHDRSGNAGPKPADGIFRFVRLNYLDTDQWHDAVEFDFKQLIDTPNAVVFDGGPDFASTKYQAAMDVLRKINQSAQIQSAGIDSSDFKVRAVEKWLSNHATTNSPVPQEQRLLNTGGAVWNLQNSDEKELLSHLNHFCFRCHSSIRFNVFDKEGVSDASAGIEGRLKRATTDPRYMPNGRVLDSQDRDRIIELVGKVFP